MVRRIRYQGVVDIGILPAAVLLKHAHTVVGVRLKHFLDAVILYPNRRHRVRAARKAEAHKHAALARVLGEIQFDRCSAARRNLLAYREFDLLRVKPRKAQLKGQIPLSAGQHRHQQGALLRLLRREGESPAPAAVLLKRSEVAERNTAGKSFNIHLRTHKLCRSSDEFQLYGRSERLEFQLGGKGVLGFSFPEPQPRQVRGRVLGVEIIGREGQTLRFCSNRNRIETLCSQHDEPVPEVLRRDCLGILPFSERDAFSVCEGVEQIAQG